MTDRRTVLRSLLLAPAWATASTAMAQQPLRVGVVPQFPAEQIFAAWTPLLRALETGTGQAFQLTNHASIPEFELAFTRGELDVAYMNPYHVVMANRLQGYLPIIRDDRQRLSGVLVVRDDSTITSVSQLNGATLAFPSPNAFGASLYMRALLKGKEGIDIEAKYVGTHSNVYRHVVTGRAAAGGGVRRTLDAEPAELRAQLRILYQTPQTYPHPVAVHPRVPADTREAIQRTLLALAGDTSAAALLAGIQIPGPAATSMEDYRDIEALSLERFVVAPD